MKHPGPGPDRDVASRRRRPPHVEPAPTQRALALLTRREHSQAELARKLAQRGVPVTEAQAVVDRLARDGWQSDVRFADALLRARASGGYGPAYVRAELANLHGLSAGVIAAAMDGFEGDWLALARDLARRRHPQAFSGAVTARRKALDFLLRRGFSMDQARAALAQSPP